MRGLVSAPAERAGLLQVVRSALAVMACALGAQWLEPAAERAVLVMSAGYLTAVAALEVGRVRHWSRSWLVPAALVFDGIYLGAVLARSGGPFSMLAFLVYLHVIAVTLLLSYRIGLVVAGWHSAVLLLTLVGEPVTTAVRQATIAQIVAFWLIGATAAALSSFTQRDLRRSEAELRSLVELGVRLEKAASADEVLECVLVHALQAASAARGAIVAMTAGETMALAATGGTAVGVEVPGLTDPDASVRQAWSGRTPVLVPVLDDGLDPMLATLVPWGTNVLVLPLTADEPLGVLVVEYGGRAGIAVPARTVDVLAEVAAHGALALRNVVLLAEVRRLATVDSLTGLANRRVLQDTLDREVARARRRHEPLSVVMLDLDHFKAINDAYGHQVGDEVLAAVGRAMTAAVRQADLAARYGGEEFVVVLPGSAPDEALLAAERLRAAVAVEGPVAVTISAGVATLPDNAHDAATLIAAADEALYSAKRGGRDRTVVARRRLGLVAEVYG